MLRKRNNKGFTLAETLLVVMIIIILAALAFVSIIAYQRSMTKLEYDGYAKEIFIAAQNHLTMLEGQGYLDSDDFGTPEMKDGKETGIYYFVVNVINGTAVTEDGTVLCRILPAASVDDTVRLGGQYIVRYHKDSAQVLDVFYWSENASPKRFSLKYDDDYATFLRYITQTYKDDPDGLKKALKDYNGAVVGYYGGVDAAGLTHGAALLAPSIYIRNEEILSVTVTNPNAANTDAKLYLIIKGETSGVVKSIPLEGYATETVVLDDITEEGKRFYEQFCSSTLYPETNLIPGENLIIQAKATSTSVFTNVAFSQEKTTNSLFAYGTTVTTAKTAFFRHLENLDDHTSKVSHNGGSGSVNITSAEQIAEMEWKGFTGAHDSNRPYAPVSPSYTLSYDGGSHSISKLVSNSTAGSAGVFGDLTGDVDGNSGELLDEIKNLKLVDLTVSGKDAAGALAGTTTNLKVTNVAAYNSKEFDDSMAKAATVSGSGSIGGLIGSVDGGAISKCAAALTVNATGNAGGLIGSVSSGSGSAAVTGCYSGGHTETGEYYTHTTDEDGKLVRVAPIWNVTGTGKAGGLIGSLSDASVSGCYSTCSAKGATAGGLVGDAKGSIAGCYAAGLVSGSAAEGAFIGFLTGSAPTGCQYFMIVNERDKNAENPGKNGFKYLDAIGNNTTSTAVTPLDADAGDYNSFVSGTHADALPYDMALPMYYHQYYERSGNDNVDVDPIYPLKSVKQLGTTLAAGDLVADHYGDWPAPETWIIND